VVDLSKEKLKLNYPCSWKYKIVILEKDNVKQIIKEVLNERPYNVKESKTSKAGKFKSYTISLIVHNEEDRKFLYEILGKHKQIKMVL